MIHCFYDIHPTRDSIRIRRELNYLILSSILVIVLHGITNFVLFDLHDDHNDKVKAWREGVALLCVCPCVVA